MPSSRISELKETSPPSRVHGVDHVLLGHAQLLGDDLDLIGAQIALLERGDAALGLRVLKNSFFWLAVVPIFTSDSRAQDVALIAALIHHIA